MVPITKIAFCTDFSENANQAFDMSFDLAQKYQAHLFLVHVVPPLVFPSPVMEDFISEQANLQFSEDASRRAMEQIDKSYLRKIGDYRNAFVRILSGHPASEILNFVEQEKVDLVVMGTHGFTGLAHFFLGSTAEKVVRRAVCSVLTVHMPNK
ncbi:MAG: universal stress protein [Thermodesulfobacteriota bacterium]